MGEIQLDLNQAPILWNGYYASFHPHWRVVILPLSTLPLTVVVQYSGNTNWLESDWLVRSLDQTITITACCLKRLLQRYHNDITWDDTAPRELSCFHGYEWCFNTSIERHTHRQKDIIREQSSLHLLHPRISVLKEKWGWMDGIDMSLIHPSEVSMYSCTLITLSQGPV